jgi:hypothetical protein
MYATILQSQKPNKNPMQKLPKKPTKIFGKNPTKIWYTQKPFILLISKSKNYENESHRYR